MIVDFDIKSLTTNFKNPTFKLLAIGAIGIGLVVFLSKNKSSNDLEDDEEKRTIIYQNEGGYTTDDIENYTENLYYALAETVGEGITDLGDIILENQEKGFSNIQDIINNNEDAGINDNDSETPDSPAPKKTTTTKKSTKKYVTVVKWTKSNTPWNSTLSGIASHSGITLAKLLSFHENRGFRKNPNLIYPGQKVRVK